MSGLKNIHALKKKLSFDVNFKTSALILIFQLYIYLRNSSQIQNCIIMGRF